MANQYRSRLAGGAATGGDALPANVLSGKTFTNDNGPQTGTMTNNGAVSQTLAAGSSYTIPEGYHDGQGTVTANNVQYVYGGGGPFTGQHINHCVIIGGRGGDSVTVSKNGVALTADEEPNTWLKYYDIGELLESDTLTVVGSMIILSV